MFGIEKSWRNKRAEAVRSNTETCQEADRAAENIGQSKITPIKKGEGLRILKKAKIEGDPITFPEREERVISTKELKENDLEPKFRIELEGTKYNVSRAFRTCDHDVMICYVETPDNEVFARSYYRSNSQGVWRYLPDYRKESEGEVSWLGKGVTEQQVALPLEIQGPLNAVADLAEEKEENADLKDMFFGTAKRVTNIVDLHKYFREKGQIDDTLHREVQDEAGENLKPWEKPNPELMKVPFEMAPDFGKQLSSFKMNSEQYKNATGRIFPSKNGEMAWLMMEDDRGRAYVASVQGRSRITSTGLRKSWIDAGHFAMPMYEYPDQSLGMGDENDRKGQYVGMWKNYLSKMPVIKEYLEARKSKE